MNSSKLLFLLFLSCGTEVGIIKVTDPDTSETTIIDTAETNEPTQPSVEPSQPSSEPSSEVLDGTVGLVSWELEQVACPACMGVSQEITVSYSTLLHQKSSQTHPFWMPLQGQCTQNIIYSSLSVNPLNLGSSIQVNGNAHNFTAYRDSNGIYSTQIMEYQYDRDSIMTVRMQDNSSFNFTSIHGFDYIEPMELRYVDPSYAFSAVVSRNGTTFWWGPYGSTSPFNITLAFYSEDGTRMLGYVSCSGADSGQMTIPAQYIQPYPYWSLVAVHMARWNTQRVPYEGLNGYVDVQLLWTVVGTAHVE